MPLLSLSIRSWSIVASALIPICPPRASISQTKCPFAVPPIEGLHAIKAMLSKLSVKSAVFQTYKNKEIILVDDGSPDNSQDIIYIVDNLSTGVKDNITLFIVSDGIFTCISFNASDKLLPNAISSYVFLNSFDKLLFLC